MLSLLLHYKYIAFFLGMIIGGDIVLIAGVYLAVQNQMHLGYIVFLAATATLISDLLWFLLGKYLTRSNVMKWRYLQKQQMRIKKIAFFFRQHSLKTIFYSKFVYGTRTIIQILSGAHKIELTSYLIVDILGTLGYIFLIVVLGYTLHVGAADLAGIFHNASISFVLFIVLLFGINSLIQQSARKHFFNDETGI